MANTEVITRRVVNSKRHTVGYILRGGRQITRRQAAQLANQNRIRNVRVINGSAGPYIQSVGGRRNLYDLPVTIESRASRPARRRRVSRQ